ncbi:hypothetical protein [Limnobacter sp.]|uniref:hypothetical protein n=1 Tax=Limnobacter sp. TaxID=2003368 RepID=UPI00391A3134
MKTATQRLAEIERKQILLLKKVRAEEARKTQKVGEFVRENMGHIEESPEFLAWLKTDIDKALFGVAIERKERTPRAEKPAKAPRPTFQAAKQPEVKTVEATATKAPAALPETVKAKVSELTKKPEPSAMTGGAGDSIRRRLSGQI